MRHKGERKKRKTWACYFRHSNLSGLAVQVPMYRCYAKSPRFLYGMREPTRHPFLYI